MWGSLSNLYPGSSVRFQSHGSCPHAHVLCLSLFRTEHVLETRILVQRLEPDSVLGIVGKELVRQSRILPKHQLERSVSPRWESAVLVRIGQVQDLVQIFNRDYHGVTSAQFSLESSLHPAGVSFASTVLVERPLKSRVCSKPSARNFIRTRP